MLETLLEGGLVGQQDQSKIFKKPKIPQYMNLKCQEVLLKHGQKCIF